VERSLALAEARDAVVLGPGLGQGSGVREFVDGFLRGCSRPVVVDADALNAIAAAGASVLRRHAPTVFTPHPGEMGRLLGTSSAEVQSHRVEAARRLASASGAVVVLKGQRTLIAEPAGRVAVNPTGNPGMATAGSGDVLSGVIGALLARGHDAWLAATAGAFIHGWAGDKAAASHGQEGMLASDIADALGTAIASVQRGEAQPGIARL
jgi:NAD(P)H-hydrate epimerase